MSHEGLRLSLVIPAYNESARLPAYLASIRRWLDDRYRGLYEVLVVDDGSRDHLPTQLSEQAKTWPQLRLLIHPQNLGKGAAVRTGILAAQGQRLLFADADGATPIEEELRLSDAIDAGADVAVGSRLVAAHDARRRRGWLRGLAGRMFALLARLVLKLPVRDTQCGFKMFRCEAGHHLFAQLQENGYLFDLELLALARHAGYRIAEVPINWQDVPGGQFRLSRALPGVWRGLWRIRRRIEGLRH